MLYFRLHTPATAQYPGNLSHTTMFLNRREFAAALAAGGGAIISIGISLSPAI